MLGANSAAGSPSLLEPARSPAHSVASHSRTGSRETAISGRGAGSCCSGSCACSSVHSSLSACGRVFSPCACVVCAVGSTSSSPSPSWGPLVGKPLGCDRHARFSKLLKDSYERFCAPMTAPSNISVLACLRCCFVLLTLPLCSLLLLSCWGHSVCLQCLLSHVLFTAALLVSPLTTLTCLWV
jgi:hypothetical protein